MKPTLLVLLFAGLTLSACSKDQAPKKDEGHGKGHDCPLCKEADLAAANAAAAKSPLDLTVKNIDGKDVNLADYKGKVVLIVNVASKCGMTKQYAGLQKLYTSRKDKGLVILGFPSNDFLNQEPGTDADIKAFCTAEYGVDFPMFSKVAVTGPDATELFKRLAAAKTSTDADAKPIGEPKWNFTKYLIDTHGDVVARFGHTVTPDAAELTKAIDAALDHKH